MKCQYCRAEFKNMDICHSHETACAFNPSNCDLTEEQRYRKAQTYRFRKERFSEGGGRARKEYFIEEIANNTLAMAGARSALIIGAANDVEGELLKKKKIDRVTAIDLTPHTSKILKMNMHDLGFSDNSFDFVLASHSLEHAMDIKRVAREICRVLKHGGYFACEMPVDYHINDVDRWDFGTVDKFLSKFTKELPEKTATKIVYSKKIPVGDDGNFCATAVIKVVMEIEKK